MVLIWLISFTYYETLHCIIKLIWYILDCLICLIITWGGSRFRKLAFSTRPFSTETKLKYTWLHLLTVLLSLSPSFSTCKHSGVRKLPFFFACLGSFIKYSIHNMYTYLRVYGKMIEMSNTAMIHRAIYGNSGAAVTRKIYNNFPLNWKRCQCYLANYFSSCLPCSRRGRTGCLVS